MPTLRLAQLFLKISRNNMILDEVASAFQNVAELAILVFRKDFHDSYAVNYETIEESTVWYLITNRQPTDSERAARNAVREDVVSSAIPDRKINSVWEKGWAEVGRLRIRAAVKLGLSINFHWRPKRLQ